MKRFLIAALLMLFAAMPARAADPDWTGRWDTRWREGGAHLELQQQGNHVTGAYPSYGGRIEGEVVGRELRGRWIEGPRFGGISFVLSADGQSFMGRYDTGEWWTGGRVQTGAREIAVDQATPRRALRTFVLAGNAARTGNPDEIAKAAAVVEFGRAGDGMAPGRKLAAARALFELVDQTTFQLWSVPGRSAQGDKIELELRQAGTGVALPLTLVRGTDQLWRISMPEGDLGSLRDALLARSNGRLLPPDDVKRRASARDAMRSFVAGFYEWQGGGRERVLQALDLSGLSVATREYEGELAAAYLNEVLNRIGQLLPQEIPDDPASRFPYTVFSHPAGSMTLAPTNSAGAPEGAGWRFTADTVRAARDLYTAVEDMPEVESGVLPDVPTNYFRIRRWVRDAAPSLFARFGPLEAWQGIGVVALLAGSLAVAYAAGWLLLVFLRRAVGGRQATAERELRWPLRIVLAFLIYQLAVPALGLPEDARRVSTGATGVLLALAAMWGGWKLIDTFGTSAMRRAEARAGTMDEILVSLLLGALKAVLITGGLLFIADALSIPYEGVIAGLGIGGLAVAFASKETLSNVFGAGILVADRPFRRGDWIEAGDTKGTVEHVGIRSTRLRTAEDSLVFVPNGKLADATVNNLGTRRHRVAKAKLLVAHGAGPDQLAAFMEGLKALAARVPEVRSNNVQVGVNSIGPEGVEIELACRLDVRTAAEERAVKTTLMLDVLRLAERLRVRLGDQDHVAPATSAFA